MDCANLANWSILIVVKCVMRHLVFSLAFFFRSVLCEVALVT